MGSSSFVELHHYRPLAGLSVTGPLSVILKPMATTRKPNPRRRPKPAEPDLSDVALVDESPDSVAKRTFVSLAVALGFGAGLWFLYLGRHILGLLVIALLIALALSPMVGWLRQRGLPRSLSAGMAVLLLVVVVSGIVGSVAPTFINQSDELARDFPGYIDEAFDEEPLKGINERFNVAEKARESTTKLPELLVGRNTPILDTAINALNAVLTTFIILALAFFMLIDGPASWQRFVRLLNPRYGRRLNHVATKTTDAVGGFVWGNLLISLAAGGVAALVMLVWGVPYVVPLAIVVGLLALIPLIGSTIATLLMALVALSQGTGTALAVLVTYGTYQVFESNIVVPMIFARTLQLSPLIILIATITGATLGGIVGVLIAIPAAAVLQIIAVELLQGTVPGRRAHIRES